MVGTASAGTSYCNEEMTSNTGWLGQYTLSIGKLSDTQTQIIVSVASAEEITGFYQFLIQNSGGGSASKTEWNPGDNDFTTSSNFSVASDKKSATILVNWTKYPTSDVQFHMILYRNNDISHGEGPNIFGNTLSGIDVSASCDGTPSDLTITSGTELELEASATSQITYTTSSTGKVTYKSSNDGVATVSASGLITAIKGGKATITVAQEADDTYAAGSKKINVNIPRLSQCSGDVGHFGNPTVKRIHYEIEYKDGAIKYTVTGLNSHKLDFLEVHDTKGNNAAAEITDGVGVYTRTGVTEGEDLGIRFLYSTDEIGGNEMNSENVNLDDPNIIYYKVGDCEAADPGLLTSDLTLTSEAEVEIAINATSQITYTTTSTGAVTYSSSKESVASVSASGLITAHKGGTAIITISQAADATYNAGSLTVEVTVPEVITETTWWGTGSDQGVSVLYSITRNLNKTLTFHVDAWGDVPNLQKPQIGFDGVGIFDMDADGNWTSTATYETDEVVNLFFYIPFTDAAARIDVAYTVGSEHVMPSIEVTGVSIDPPSATVEVDKTTSLTAIIKPAFATNKNISWSVIAGSEYASVNANGVVTGLAAGAATVQVKTESGSKTATCNVNVVAQVLTEPDAAPAAPTVPANQVKAVYSGTYSANCNFGDWGAGSGNDKQTYGWKFYNNIYFGLVGFTYNCSQMETLHMDIWVAEDFNGMQIAPINGGAPEQLKTLTLEGQKWNSIDVPMTEFVNDKDFSNVYQIKFAGLSNKTFWVNNVYFYTTQTKTTCALSASVKNNEGGTASVSIADVAKGGTATFTAEAACGYSFVGWWNNSTKVSEDATYIQTNIQEDLSLVAEFSFVGPAEAATVPSYDMMIPIYTNGTPAEGVSMTTSWGQRTIQNSISVAGHTMFKYGNISYQGIAFENNVRNVSTMQYIHLDIWSTETGIIKFFLIWPGQGNETSVTVDLIGCQWNSINIPLNKFSGADLTQIHQFKLDAQTSTVGEGAIDGATILVQDIFFYAPNEFTLSETESNETNLEAFNGKVCDVTIGRTFEAGNLYTLALPFDMTEAQVAETFGACTMYKLAESYWKVANENMYIRFAPVTEFEANTPILFTPAENIAANEAVAREVTIKNGDCETPTDLVTFHGTYSKKNLAALNYILAADQYLYPVVGDNYSINGMRGYFSFGASVPQAPKMARIILHEEITTDNAFLRNEKQEMRAKKVLENGRFVIIRDGARYGVLGVEEQSVEEQSVEEQRAKPAKLVKPVKIVKNENISKSKHTSGYYRFLDDNATINQQ